MQVERRCRQPVGNNSTPNSIGVKLKCKNQFYAMLGSSVNFYAMLSIMNQILGKHRLFALCLMDFTKNSNLSLNFFLVLKPNLVPTLGFKFSIIYKFIKLDKQSKQLATMELFFCVHVCTCIKIKLTTHFFGIKLTNSIFQCRVP